ncbi:Uu.00g127850.m01.CDS01 [Anthostomella pinea]|uniref:Uu.00g127850.m01.CDS01 n=1 Tax=Anthostomella pinea TaxID=933095 RepID=A0AAI8VIT4_9PEZI|nr:Uu.00g127850.m01.CDS01 [Anthostomella pinea]
MKSTFPNAQDQPVTPRVLPLTLPQNDLSTSLIEVPHKDQNPPLSLKVVILLISSLNENFHFWDVERNKMVPRNKRKPAPDNTPEKQFQKPVSLGQLPSDKPDLKANRGRKRSWVLTEDAAKPTGQAPAKKTRAADETSLRTAAGGSSQNVETPPVTKPVRIILVNKTKPAKESAVDVHRSQDNPSEETNNKVTGHESDAGDDIGPTETPLRAQALSRTRAQTRALQKSTISEEHQDDRIDASKLPQDGNTPVQPRYMADAVSNATQTTPKPTSCPDNAHHQIPNAKATDAVIKGKKDFISQIDGKMAARLNVEELIKKRLDPEDATSMKTIELEIVISMAVRDPAMFKTLMKKLRVVELVRGSNPGSSPTDDEMDSAEQ